MKKYPAIAAIEFRDVSAGMYATDAMLKKAPIGFVKTGTITRGRFVALIGGSTGSVEESFHEGRFWGGESVIDSVLLADVHPQLHDAILGGALPHGSGSLAVLETPTVCATIRGAESALKGTPVSLLCLRLADDGLSGKGITVLQGELHDVEAAVDIFRSMTSLHGHEALHRILTSPHEAMVSTFAEESVFTGSRLVELEGELS